LIDYHKSVRRIDYKNIVSLINEKNKPAKRADDLAKEPDVLIILTGGKVAYADKNGVKIIPIGCLKN